MAVANPVLFELGGSTWTLGGGLIVFALLTITVWACTIPWMARRTRGYTRPLEADEAASLAMSAHETDLVKPTLLAHGPAVGAEARFELTIGDLRQAWQQKRYGFFFGVPAYWLTFMASLGALGIGGALLKNNLTIAWIALAPLGFFGLMMLFSMWAAVFTKLE